MIHMLCPITLVLVEHLAFHFESDPARGLFNDEVIPRLEELRTLPSLMCWETGRTRAYVCALLTAEMVVSAKGVLDGIFSHMRWEDLQTEKICRELQARSDGHVVAITSYELGGGGPAEVIKGKGGQPLGLETAQRMYPLYDAAVVLLRHVQALQTGANDLAHWQEIGARLAEIMRLASIPWNRRLATVELLAEIDTEQHPRWRSMGLLSFKAELYRAWETQYSAKP